MNLQEELFRVADALRAAGIEYALCGGMAVIIHGYPRLTRDIDILVQERDLDRTREAVRPIGYTLDSGILPFDAGKPTERRVFRVTKTEGQDYLTLDLILVGPFLEDVWRGRERHRIGERELDVVSLAGLAKMKRAAGRPQDLADLDLLEPDEDGEP